MLHGIRLAGANLRGWWINAAPQEAQDATNGLDLGPADFAAADLRETRFEHRRMQVRTSAAPGWSARYSSVAGWTGAELYRTRFLFCEPDTALPEIPHCVIHKAPALHAPLPNAIGTKAQGYRLATQWGHQDWVHSCTFHPMASGLASAGGRDGTVRLWDAASGECLRIHAMGDTSSHGVWLPANNRIVEVAGDAPGNGWHGAGWTRKGQATCLPLESFGPIPMARRPTRSKG